MGLLERNYHSIKTGRNCKKLPTLRINIIIPTTLLILKWLQTDYLLRTTSYRQPDFQSRYLRTFL